MPKLTRRDFVRSAAVAAAVLGIPAAHEPPKEGEEPPPLPFKKQ